MADVRLKAPAMGDLDEIDEFGATEFGAPVADEYGRGFRDAFDLLRRHPFAGSARPELGKGVRCIVHRRHRIFYVATPEMVQILRIFHHSCDVRKSHMQ